MDGQIFSCDAGVICLRSRGRRAHAISARNRGGVAGDDSASLAGYGLACLRCRFQDRIEKRLKRVEADKLRKRRARRSQNESDHPSGRVVQKRMRRSTFGNDGAQQVAPEADASSRVVDADEVAAAERCRRMKANKLASIEGLSGSIASHARDRGRACQRARSR